MTSRTFPLADVLTVTTGRMLSATLMGGLHELLDYMTGDTLFTHQLPRASEACARALLAQHPQLEGVTPAEDISAPEIAVWLHGLVLEFGAALPVAPLEPGQWQHRNPVQELCDMLGPEKVIVVVDGEAQP